MPIISAVLNPNRSILYIETTGGLRVVTGKDIKIDLNLENEEDFPYKVLDQIYLKTSKKGLRKGYYSVDEIIGDKYRLYHEGKFYLIKAKHFEVKDKDENKIY